MTREEALQLAAQCWCDPRTENNTLDLELATVFAEQLFIVTNPGAHYCTEWDYFLIAPGEPEWDACICNK